MVAVNPEVLKWARKNVLLEAELAAKRIGLRDSRQFTAVEKLTLIESGERQPTSAQLHKMAKAYHQPLLSLYLDTPPEKAPRGHDFRSLPQKTADALGNARLDLLMRNIGAAQGLARGLLEDEGVEPLPFVDSASTELRPDILAQEIADAVGFERRVFRNQPNTTKAFEYVRTCLESSGIFVLLLSNLGSWHTKIDVTVFRGFALADSIAPFIVINKQDAKIAWSFTAFHEAAHLWLGSTGISGAWSEEPQDSVEVFCNRVAAALLLSEDEPHDLGNSLSQDFDDALTQITNFAKPRHLSRAMVSYSLLRRGYISQSQWRAQRQRFDEDRRAQADAEREERRRREAGPDSNTVKKRDLGSALLNLVKRTVDAGVLTPRKAGVILGVNPRRVEALIDL